MSYLPATAKLSNPTHKVVGPDGTELFLIKHTRQRLRIRILFDAAWVSAGQVSEGYGPSAADDVMMGRWIGPLRFHFGAIIDSLPDGTHCVEIGRTEPSLYDYSTDIIWSGWEGAGYFRESGFTRASGERGRRDLPVTRPQRDKARAQVTAHLDALLDGTYRRDDGPMVENTAPKVPGVSYYPTYVKGEGTPVPLDILPSFIADAERARAYLDFLDTLPDMPERDRTRPATPSELNRFAAEMNWTHRPAPIRAYAANVVETGIIDLRLAAAAESERIRLANIETEKLIAARAA